MANNIKCIGAEHQMFHYEEYHLKFLIGLENIETYFIKKQDTKIQMNS